MRRRKVIIGVVALILFGVLLALLWPEIREPVYDGKKLSEWVEQLGREAQLRAGDDRTVDAIKAIGTNGIPYYIKWFQYKEGVVKKLQTKLGRKYQWFAWVLPLNDREADRADGAYWALIILREKAQAAIPRLTIAATDSANWDYGYAVPTRAIDILAFMGDPAMPAFLSLMTNADARVRAMTVGYFRFDPGSTSKLAHIQKALGDPDFAVRVAATNSLRQYVSRSGEQINP